MTLKYEQIMDKIEVTPEMRQRVLRNVEAEQAKQKKRQLTRRLVTSWCAAGTSGSRSRQTRRNRG